MKVTKEYALAEASRAARLEATRLDEESAEYLLDEATERITDLFDSLAVGQIDDNKPLEEWHHRQSFETLDDWRRLGINREHLKQSAAAYVNTSWLSTPTLDWFVADVLMYAELIAFFTAIRTQQLGILGSALDKGGVVARAFRWVWALCRLAIWVVAVVALYYYQPAFAVVFVLGTVILRCLIWWKSRPVGVVLREMNNCYMTLASGTFSWNVVWDELRRTRELGAVWDGELYRLVESRKVESHNLRP